VRHRARDGIVERLLSISGDECMTIDRKNLESVMAMLLTRFASLTHELPPPGRSEWGTGELLPEPAHAAIVVRATRTAGRRIGCAGSCRVSCSEPRAHGCNGATGGTSSSPSAAMNSPHPGMSNFPRRRTAVARRGISSCTHTPEGREEA
jgi:hypothetical protein